MRRLFHSCFESLFFVSALAGSFVLVGCDGGSSSSSQTPDASTSEFDYSPENVSVLRVRSDPEFAQGPRMLEQRAKVDLATCFVERNLLFRNTSFTMHPEDCETVLSRISRVDLLSLPICANEAPSSGSYLAIEYDDGSKTATCAISAEPVASILDEYLVLPVRSMPWPIALNDLESPYDQSIVSPQAGNYFHHGVDVGTELLEQVYSSCRGRVTDIGHYVEELPDANHFGIELSCLNGVRLQYHHVDEMTVTPEAEASLAQDAILEVGVELGALVDFSLDSFDYPHLHLNAVDELGSYLNPLVMLEEVGDTEPPTIEGISLVPADDQFTQLPDGGVDAFGDFWVDVTAVDQRTLEEEVISGMGVIPPRWISFVITAKGSGAPILEYTGYDFISLPLEECSDPYDNCIDVGLFDHFPDPNIADVIRVNGLSETGEPGSAADAQSLGSGEFDITVTACDEYGNCAEETTSFEVTSTAG